MKRAGFTLFEIVMVIVIVAILSVVATPIYLNLRPQAIESSEGAVVANLKEAIKHRYAQNIITGSSEVEAWPSENPFDLLVKSPPHQSVLSAIQIDGYWKRYNRSTAKFWYIYCPHWDGDAMGNNYTKGRMWVYCYSNSDPNYGLGEFVLFRDAGH